MDEMKAGRELDALVAEKVMGWHRRKGFWATTENWDTEEQVGDWSPSTDIAAVWELVRELTDVRHYRVEVVLAGDECPTWICKLYMDGYRSFQDKYWEESANTAPLAICLAALKAVGYTVDTNTEVQS